jgi:hypothetical protein
VFVTVIPLSDGCVSVKEDWLREAIARYDKSDDVFRKDFLSGVMFTGSSKVQVTPEAIEMLHSAGTSWIEVVDANTPSTPHQGLIMYSVSGCLTYGSSMMTLKVHF